MMRSSIFISSLALLSVASPALAQSGDLTPEQKQEKAIKLFNEAESYYNLQEYEKALNLYKEAYLLSQEPALLYNIGQCQRQTKRYEEAIKSYRAFLRTSQDEELRPRIEVFIQEMEAELKKGGPTTGPTSSTSKPVDEPKTSLPLPKFILLGAGGLGGVSVLTGAVSLFEARSSRKLQLEGTTDPEKLAAAANLSSLMGNISTITFAVALGAGGAGYALKQRQEKEPLLSSKLLYGASASTAAITLGAGGLALFAARDAKELQSQGSQNQELVTNRQRFSSEMGIISEASLVAAVMCGAGGFLLSKKEKAALLLSPSSVAIQVTF